MMELARVRAGQGCRWHGTGETPVIRPNEFADGQTCLPQERYFQGGIMLATNIVVESKTIGEPFGGEEELRAWVAKNLRLRFPKQGVCANHVSPFEYLRRSYFEPSTDLVV